MHPPSPILQSDSPLIQIYFGGLVLISLLIAWQVARLWLRLDPDGSPADASISAPGPRNLFKHSPE